MHRGDLRAVTGDADKPHQTLRARFNQCLERSARSHRSRPLIFGHEIVHLDQIKLFDAQSFERAMETVARALISAVASLAGEEKSLAMLAHPRPDSQFRLAVRRRRIDMIDAVFEQHLEHAVSLFLLHPAERGGAENNPRTLMPGFSEWIGVDHDV